nr:MAG TPA: hypothetical protein [Caudoviricetes sp.]
MFLCDELLAKSKIEPYNVLIIHSVSLVREDRGVFVS